MKQLYLYVFTLITTISPFVLSASSPVDEVKQKLKTKTKIKISQDTVSTDSVVVYDADPTKAFLGSDSVVMFRMSTNPYATLHQHLKGHVPGLYIQETSGEPGTIKQGSLIRGISKPVLNASDFERNKPLILINGIPLIDDPSIVYNIQNNTIQPIGAATNLQSIIDMDNVESIKILKDYSTAAIYGPRASNGVIYITTKAAKAGQRKISVNGQFGFATPENVTTTNALFERNFRTPFYEKYAELKQEAAYPAYLSDSSNVNYYGPSNWVDLYYKSTPVYSINGSLEGGSERANFRFFGTFMENAGSADDASLNKYQAAFYLNMLPVKWFTISTMLQGTRLQRDRNSSLLERLGETGYVPNMTTPLSPNKSMYSLYLSEMAKSIDENMNTSLLGSISLNFAILKNLNFAPKLYLDYNENVRNVFWPSTVMSNNNYASNYFGFNQRIALDNVLNYKLDFDNNASLLFEGGFNYQSDTQKYNFIQAFAGTSDEIKIIQTEGNSSSDTYLRPLGGFIPFYFQDRIDYRLASFYSRLSYTKNNVYEFSGLVRYDSSSAVQPSSRWFTSYALSAKYNLNDIIKVENVDRMFVFGSWGRLGNVPENDTDAAGPQYSSNLGWSGNNPLSSYNGSGTVSRPYSSGWVGYNLPWSYTNMLNVGMDYSMFKDRLGVKVEYYNKNTKDLTIGVPTVAESGYQFERLHGMSINNQGVDFSLDVSWIRKSGFQWNSSFNVGYNNNELRSLPNDLKNITIGSKRIEVGEHIDKFWLLQNNGIYINDLDVPVQSGTYKVLTYSGLPMHGGDPRWIDVDNNFDINNEDRVLMGNYIPKYTGGLFNKVVFKDLDLSFLLYFNLKKDILNAQASNFMDFGNRDESLGLESIREVTFWEKNFDETKYPQYNPWSAVSPYQSEQDMFLEDGSFLKLRNMTLGYNFSSLSKQSKFSKIYLFVTGTNLFTITKYSGRDPELVDFYGYDTGVGLRFPKTYVLGIKLDF